MDDTSASAFSSFNNFPSESTTQDNSVFSRYADLPDEVLEEVLGRAAEVAAGVRTLFTRVDENKARLRETLKATGRIRHGEDLPVVALPAVAAVDGGAAVEKSLGTDTALAVAVGVEGIHATTIHWSGVQYASWQRTLPHEGEQTAATCRGVMAALELFLLRDTPHEVIFLDGSHLTPVIALNTLLGVRHDDLRREVAELVEKRDTADALLVAMTRPEVVAVVKYDTSRDLLQTWLPAEMRGAGIGLDDRTLMTLLLEAGEYTEPISLTLTQQSRSNWLTRRIEVLNPVDAARERVRLALNEIISLVRDDGLYATYYKPEVWSPAFRLEIKPDVAQSPERLAQVLKAVRSQVISPEIREPYPQWVADRMAKSVGDALTALRIAINYDLADAGLAEYIALTAFSYRTESV